MRFNFRVCTIADEYGLKVCIIIGEGLRFKV